jgi:hypothetical protein
LTRSQLPPTEVALGVERLRDTLFEFVKRYTNNIRHRALHLLSMTMMDGWMDGCRLKRKSSTRIPSIVDNGIYLTHLHRPYLPYHCSDDGHW